jgi:hypothetical protein
VLRLSPDVQVGLVILRQTSLLALTVFGKAFGARSFELKSGREPTKHLRRSTIRDVVAKKVGHPLLPVHPENTGRQLALTISVAFPGSGAS